MEDHRFVRGAAFAATAPEAAAQVRDLAALLSQLDDLADEADLVLDGDPNAAARWRTLLAWTPEGRADDAPIDWVASPSTEWLRESGVQRLWSATMVAARTLPQLTAMTRRLVELLAPLAMIARLYGAPPGAVRTMSAVGVPGMPGQDSGGWVPGSRVRPPSGRGIGLGQPGGGRPGDGRPGGPLDDDFDLGIPNIGDLIWPGTGRRPVGEGEGPIDIDSAEEFWEAIFDLTRNDPRMPCDVKATLGIAQFRADAGGDYALLSVSPQGACPGTTIRINATNIIVKPDTVVVFPNNIEVRPVHIEANRIDVVVPSGAVSGQLRVKSMLGRVYPCDEIVTVYQDGQTARFYGGFPEFLSFTVNGTAGEVLVDSDAPLTVAWEVSSATADITIVVSGVSSTTIRWPNVRNMPVQLPRGAGGHWITATYDSCGRTATAQVYVWHGSPASIEIAGIEVTQGIQEHIRPGEAWESANRSKWNSLELAAGKPTIVRVFPRLTYAPGAVLGGAYTLSATLELHDPSTGKQVGPLLPALRSDANFQLHAGVRMTTWAKAPLRNATLDSFNFHIPAGYATGELNLIPRITVEAGWWPGRSTSTARSVRWRPKGSLNVHYVRVYGKDGGPTPLPDSVANTVVRAGLALLPYPVDRVRPSPTPTMVSDEWWTAEDGNHVLLEELIEISDCYDETHYIGVVNNALPVTGALLGTARDNQTTCWAIQEPVVIAHEMAHCLGFKHVVGHVPPDPLYGNLLLDELPNKGAIANVPFDIARFRTLTDLAGTSTLWDFMVAAGPVVMTPFVVRPLAVSEHNWTRLINTNIAW